MKILTSRSSAGYIGGGEMAMLDQAVALKLLGNEIVVVSNLKYVRQTANDNGMKSRFSLWAYRDYSLWLRVTYFVVTWPLMWVHYGWIVWREKPDIIYPHSRDDQIIFTLLKVLHRKPVVWNDPSDLYHFLHRPPGNALSLIHRWFLLQSIARASKIFTLTQQERKNILRYAKPYLKAGNIDHMPSNILFDNYDLKAKSP